MRNEHFEAVIVKSGNWKNCPTNNKMRVDHTENIVHYIPITDEAKKLTTAAARDQVPGALLVAVSILNPMINGNEFAFRGALTDLQDVDAVTEDLTHCLKNVKEYAHKVASIG